MGRVLLARLFLELFDLFRGLFGLSCHLLLTIIGSFGDARLGKVFFAFLQSLESPGEVLLSLAPAFSRALPFSLLEGLRGLAHGFRGLADRLGALLQRGPRGIARALL